MSDCGAGPRDSCYAMAMNAIATKSDVARLGRTLMLRGACGLIAATTYIAVALLVAG